MPTGYTYGVSNGTITDVNEYVLQCARAFGATIMMRDEPLNTPIPEFQPHSYHYEALEEARKKIEELTSLTKEQITERIDLNHWYKIENNKKIRSEKMLEQKRYSDMLEKVKEWKVPTSEHNNLKEFCINQLEESMKHGFSEEELDQYYPLDIPKLTPEEWLESQLTRINKDIEHHAEGWNKEVKVTNERNEWVRWLKVSLEQMTVDN
ncbi:hypothetical protein [Paenibacillus medicaginis]|uniref:Uncharacterized protein n=1 Tax=Paenibacillus medicaginis TaxID=1470560 RepID=A0ABV5BUK7_9BACL